MKSLQDKVSNLSGIGPKKELALKALGIETIEDLLCYYPFRYEDMATKEVSELADGQKAVIQGVVATAPVVVRFGRAKNRLNFKLLAGHDVIQITFFGQAHVRARITIRNRKYVQRVNEFRILVQPVRTRQNHFSEFRFSDLFNFQLKNPPWLSKLSLR